MKKHFLAGACLAAIALMTTGCGEKTVDTSTDEAMKTSLQEVRAALTAEKQPQFDDALQALAFSGIDGLDDLVKLAADPDAMNRQLKGKIQGKTAVQIIAEGDRVIAERKAKEREQALGEIKELQGEIEQLQQGLAEQEEAKANLDKFQVVRSRFYFQNTGTYIVTSDPIIELTVKNGTAQAVSRAYFHGTLSSPGRSVPWVADSFNYQISGGIEPGEADTWRLAPNSFSDWGKAPKDKDDMVLTVATTRIDGADGKAIYDVREAGKLGEAIEKAKARIAQLEKSL